MSGPNGDPQIPLGEVSGEEDYAALDFMLDQINFCLDHLEEKNDLLHAQLQDLLESNRQARRDFQEQLSRSGADNTPQLGEGV
ncbi:bublin coiled-coil protein [Bufo gargarizans]|uniref:bublin coiled-coil protein n=1 Tax=Bufo gargarizans TaxID=30331 RepID=UPI001CF5CCF7|nr:bublin coiled-coil protein [Bufo gargarizans]